MRTWVIFLRGVNVGGHTMVSMRDVITRFSSLGLANVRTYINSGNIVVQSRKSEASLRTLVERALHEMTGRAVGLTLRSAEEVLAIRDANPFPEAIAAQVGVLLLDTPPAADLLDGATTQGREQLRAGSREIYIHYPDGMGRSTLRLPSTLKNGTVRNINTITRLAAMVRE